MSTAEWPRADSRPNMWSSLSPRMENWKSETKEAWGGWSQSFMAQVTALASQCHTHAGHYSRGEFMTKQRMKHRGGNQDPGENASSQHSRFSNYNTLWCQAVDSFWSVNPPPPVFLNELGWISVLTKSTILEETLLWQICWSLYEFFKSNPFSFSFFPRCFS